MKVKFLAREKVRNSGKKRKPKFVNNSSMQLRSAFAMVLFSPSSSLILVIIGYIFGDTLM